jgi:DNA (cytosine-5)-methyltransferase 1
MPFNIGRQKMKYFSTFTGIGGFEAAIHNVIPQAECAGFSEIDKFAIVTYLKNFPDHEFLNFGDISKIDVSSVPDFDLLIGGSPCTDLSIAKGKREGLAGSRSGLFFKYVELLAYKKPKYFILENVASMSKEAREEITATLQSVTGDKIHVVEICSDHFTPQKRRRLYWTNFAVKKPAGEGERWPDLVAWSSSNDYDKEGTFIRKREREVRDGRSNTCTTGQGCGSFSSKNYIDDFGVLRILTPEECERLQGFPESWSIGSNAQRYKQIGNAVTVPVIEHILKEMLK